MFLTGTAKLHAQAHEGKPDASAHTTPLGVRGQGGIGANDARSSLAGICRAIIINDFSQLVCGLIEAEPAEAQRLILIVHCNP
jgi:hypothetical protein